MTTKITSDLEEKVETIETHLKEIRDILSSIQAQIEWEIESQKERQFWREYNDLNKHEDQ